MWPSARLPNRSGCQRSCTRSAPKPHSRSTPILNRTQHIGSTKNVIAALVPSSLINHDYICVGYKPALSDSTPNKFETYRSHSYNYAYFFIHTFLSMDAFNFFIFSTFFKFLCSKSFPNFQSSPADEGLISRFRDGAEPAICRFFFAISAASDLGIRIGRLAIGERREYWRETPNGEIGRRDTPSEKIDWTLINFDLWLTSV